VNGAQCRSLRLRCDDDHKKAHFNPADYLILLARNALWLTFARRLTAFSASNANPWQKHSRKSDLQANVNCFTMYLN
jgi:hypothetical protein